MFGRRSLALVGAYGLLLAASHVYLHLEGRAAIEPEAPSVEVVDAAGQAIRIAYDDNRGAGPCLLLIHGNPGDSHAFRPLTAQFGEKFRIVAPDLPGFGRSTRQLDDYSIRAQAERVAALLDQLNLQHCHVAGHSLGGGVAIHLAALRPNQVRSLTLISSVGVQETELTGDYEINHALHGVQLAAITAALRLTPHFGVLGESGFSYGYARSFYDSDQRPLGSLLRGLRMPVFIVHGRGDGMVPVETALAAHRLAPRSRLLLLESDHFFLFRRPEVLADALREFLTSVESGNQILSLGGPVETPVESRQPLEGVALGVMLAVLAAATFVSEDLACIAAGLLVAHGRIAFPWAAGACFVGVFSGDLGLFAIGRGLGRWPALRRQARARLSADDLERAMAWVTRHRAAAVFLSRFTPGLRLPTYLAAGALGVPLLRFAGLLAVAALLWTPFLVGSGAFIGAAAARMSPSHWAVWSAVTVALFVSAPSAGRKAWKRRRRIAGAMKRLTRWEFWPQWITYIPVVVYMLWLAVKHRGATLFTAANPAFDGGGGLVGESKAKILRALELAGAPVARFITLAAHAPETERLATAEQFMRLNGLSFPIVVKPDVGERGKGVEIVRSLPQLSARLSSDDRKLIVQEYVGGAEYGVFYYRFPGEDSGAILSITEKRLPEVAGDGRSTFEELILADDRAMCLASLYLRNSSTPRDAVIPSGVRQRLVEVGSHCRGAVFLDAAELRSAALLARLDAISRNTPGFYYGRYDLRTPSAEALTRGEDFRVLELNGVSAESVNVYDPKLSLREAYWTLFLQWRVAFEIGARSRALGFRPTPLVELIAMVRAHWAETEPTVPPRTPMASTVQRA